MSTKKYRFLKLVDLGEFNLIVNFIWDENLCIFKIFDNFVILLIIIILLNILISFKKYWNFIKMKDNKIWIKNVNF